MTDGHHHHHPHHPPPHHLNLNSNSNGAGGIPSAASGFAASPPVVGDDFHFNDALVEAPERAMRRSYMELYLSKAISCDFVNCLKELQAFVGYYTYLQNELSKCRLSKSYGRSTSNRVSRSVMSMTSTNPSGIGALPLTIPCDDWQLSTSPASSSMLNCGTVGREAPAPSPVESSVLPVQGEEENGEAARQQYSHSPRVEATAPPTPAMTPSVVQMPYVYGADELLDRQGLTSRSAGSAPHGACSGETALPATRTAVSLLPSNDASLSLLLETQPEQRRTAHLSPPAAASPAVSTPAPSAYRPAESQQIPSKTTTTASAAALPQTIVLKPETRQMLRECYRLLAVQSSGGVSVEAIIAFDTCAFPEAFERMMQHVQKLTGDDGGQRAILSQPQRELQPLLPPWVLDCTAALASSSTAAAITDADFQRHVEAILIADAAQGAMKAPPSSALHPMGLGGPTAPPAAAISIEDWIDCFWLLCYTEVLACIKSLRRWVAAPPRTSTTAAAVSPAPIDWCSAVAAVPPLRGMSAWELLCLSYVCSVSGLRAVAAAEVLNWIATSAAWADSLCWTIDQFASLMDTLSRSLAFSDVLESLQYRGGSIISTERLAIEGSGSHRLGSSNSSSCGDDHSRGKETEAVWQATLPMPVSPTSRAAPLLYSRFLHLCCRTAPICEDDAKEMSVLIASHQEQLKEPLPTTESRAVEPSLLLRTMAEQMAALKERLAALEASRDCNTGRETDDKRSGVSPSPSAPNSCTAASIGNGRIAASLPVSSSTVVEIAGRGEAQERRPSKFEKERRAPLHPQQSSRGKTKRRMALELSPTDPTGTMRQWRGSGNSTDGRISRGTDDDYRHTSCINAEPQPSRIATAGALLYRIPAAPMEAAILSKLEYSFFLCSHHHHHSSGSSGVGSPGASSGVSESSDSSDDDQAAAVERVLLCDAAGRRVISLLVRHNTLKLVGGVDARLQRPTTTASNRRISHPAATAVAGAAGVTSGGGGPLRAPNILSPTYEDPRRDGGARAERRWRVRSKAAAHLHGAPVDAGVGVAAPEETVVSVQRVVQRITLRHRLWYHLSMQFDWHRRTVLLRLRCHPEQPRSTTASPLPDEAPVETTIPMIDGAGVDGVATLDIYPRLELVVAYCNVVASYASADDVKL